MAVGDTGVVGVVGLKCEYAVDPIGMEEARPRFWE